MIPDELSAKPIIETERLRLRQWRETDVPVLMEIHGNEEAAKFVGGVKTFPEVWRMVALYVGHWQWKGFGLWCVEEKSSTKPIGWCGLWEPEGFPEKELGYGLVPSAQGLGYATEAATASARHAYEILGWETIISLIHKDNAASQGVARKLGAIKEQLDLQVMDWTADLWRHLPPAIFHERFAK